MQAVPSHLFVHVLRSCFLIIYSILFPETVNVLINLQSSDPLLHSSPGRNSRQQYHDHLLQNLWCIVLTLDLYMPNLPTRDTA